VFDDTALRISLPPGIVLAIFRCVRSAAPKYVAVAAASSVAKMRCIKAVFIDRLVKTFRIAFFLEHFDVNSSIITSWTTMI
jgi:hypothetical protein